MKRILPIFLSLLFSLASCQKDPLTLPAKVKLFFGMIPMVAENEEVKDASLNSDLGGKNFLIIDDGTLVISKIDFEGYRENASNFFFSANFDPPIIVDLKEESANYQIQFDIPQGIYERIEFVFYLGAPGYLPLVMNGEADLPITGNKLIRFEYEYSEPVRVRAQGISGEQIVLRKDIESKATLLVDAQQLFRMVNQGRLIAAEILNEQGNDLILITQGMNTPIFNVIAERLRQSFKVIFE